MYQVNFTELNAMWGKLLKYAKAYPVHSVSSVIYDCTFFIGGEEKSCKMLLFKHV